MDHTEKARKIDHHTLSLEADARRLDKIHQAALTYQAAVNECEGQMQRVQSKLKTLLETQPDAVAEFLDTSLIRDTTGSIARLPDGRVKGYTILFGIEIDDPALTKSIYKWTTAAARACRLR